MIKYIKKGWFFILTALSVIVLYIFSLFRTKQNVKTKSYYNAFKENRFRLEKEAEEKIKIIEKEANAKNNKIQSVNKIKDKKVRLQKLADLVNRKKD